MSEPVNILYLARSDGTEVTADGKKNRPSDSQIRPDVTTREKGDEYYVLIDKEDEKYRKALKECGGYLAKYFYDKGMFGTSREPRAPASLLSFINRGFR
jgi:hypothetical protein